LAATAWDAWGRISRGDVPAGTVRFSPPGKVTVMLRALALIEK
jgi:hypothetical protein